MKKHGQETCELERVLQESAGFFYIISMTYDVVVLL